MADIDPLRLDKTRFRSHLDLDVQHPRADAVGPGPRVQGRRVRGRGVQEAARRPFGAARRVLPPRRRRVHPHPGTRAAALDSGTRRGQARQADRRRAEVHPEQAQRGRSLRDLPTNQIRWAEAILARRCGDRHPDDGRRDRPSRRARPRRSRHRHAAPRPAQRAGQHRRQAVLADLQRVRGQPESVAGPRLRRREVPPRRRRHLPPDVRRQRHRGVAGGQPEPPGGRRPGARGPGPRQAGPARQGRRARRVLDRSDDAARRRRVRRAGRRRRDAEPRAAARLPHRRHDPHRRQQPDRLHHVAAATRGPASTAPTSRR